jgi:hypothetical protein
MRRCPVCGADLALYRQRKNAAVMRWQKRNRDRYNTYMREYMRKYTQRKRQAASRDVI